MYQEVYHVFYGAVSLLFRYKTVLRFAEKFPYIFFKKDLHFIIFSFILYRITKINKGLDLSIRFLIYRPKVLFDVIDT